MQSEEKSRSRERNLQLILAVCTSVLITACSLILLHTSAKLQVHVTRDLSTQYAQEINAHMAAGIESTFTSFSYECQTMGAALGQESGLTLDRLDEFIGSMQDAGSMSYLGFLDRDGYLYDYKGCSLGTTRIGIVAELINGKDHVVSDNESIYQQNYIMYGTCLHTPLQVEGTEIFAIIIGITNDDMAQRLLLASDYSQSYASIIQRDGYYIVKNDHESASGLNEFSILRDAYEVSEKDLDQVEASVAEGEFSLISGTSSQQVDYYLCFTAVPDTQWVLVSHIPQDFVRKSVQEMKSSLTTTTFVIISLIVVLGCAFIRSLMLNNRKLAERQRELDAALIAANSANVAKTRFLNNMSHDIRTPMNAIIGMLAMIRRQTQDAQVLGSVEKISTSANYLLSLINDVLDISRIESGKTKLDLQPVAPKQMVDTVADITRHQLSDRKLEFEVSQDSDSHLLVLADALRIQEILLNILNNALKFTPDGGKISLIAQSRPGEDENHICVSYTISDTGQGMSEEFQKTIFDEFAQENQGARTQYKGTGLGMSIVKRLVEMMNGTITVQSKLGEGSTFVVTIPLELTDQTIEPETDDEALQVSVEGLHILLAEDNDLNAEIAEFILEDHGIISQRACNGREAVELFRDHPADTYDLILMDVMMPEMDGYEATRTIRAMADRPDSTVIPILAMTANAFREDAEEAAAAGLNAHLSKPINEEELIRSIAKYVGIARQNRTGT